ncbi:protein of unknown function (DUF305) [Maritimibacter alkaliphilus HTCC2654]|uniref:DUF305 domain-containing protein n=1 Tax=Maritimibacter alkaliphilus HTCC2654 TaxID=314271 RepID=A3VEI2_9RHOB|nr:DUF305 domain-containing protein [Maritimibacter alkaliphilus]EAQ13320.1 hypothetical protein RB2654_09629 [Rhodobacterales bacterium HTCC2654] [Maritimibacter alkaliphilus HTCC2654]TYP85261.1 protein of unknown function (DUF305) [Maritimibacter alkaliphilus HTCC2654]
MSYWRFAAMIATSTLIMFGLMYLNTYLLGHVFFSETRAYMAVLMGATMAFVMLAFMLSMYASKAINASIFVGSIVVFASSLWLVRSQATVGDVSYMRAMIPHHSIAIMTSNRSNLSDPRVQELAGGIAEAQNKEIAEMRYLISDIAQNGDQPEAAPKREAEIVDLETALSTPVLSRLDAEPLTPGDIAKAYENGARCTFSYTTEGQPVLATNGDTALIKISEDLVELVGPAPTFETQGLNVELSRPEGASLSATDVAQTKAIMVLEIESSLKAGYEGWWRCARQRDPNAS